MDGNNKNTDRTDRSDKGNRRKSLFLPTVCPKNKTLNDHQIKQYRFYGSRKADITFIVYIVAILLWSFFLLYLSPPDDGWGLLILMIPFVTFLISMFSLNQLSVQAENGIGGAFFLAAALVVIVHLLSTFFKNTEGEKSYLLWLTVVAIIFALISAIDIWVPAKWGPLLKHIKTMFQTAFYTLLIYIIYLFYRHDRSFGGISML